MDRPTLLKSTGPLITVQERKNIHIFPKVTSHKIANNILYHFLTQLFMPHMAAINFVLIVRYDENLTQLVVGGLKVDCQLTTNYQ